jgi:hypothetical protein
MATNSQNAFTPLGSTIVVPADAVAPAGLQALVSERNRAQNVGQYRIINASTTVTVFLGVGATADEATANTVAPIAGTESNAIVLVPGAVEILRFGPEAFFSGLGSAPATVYITPGQGLKC